MYMDATEQMLHKLLASCVMRAGAPLRWVVFSWGGGRLGVGRELAHPSYTSKKKIRIAVRTPSGTEIIERDVQKHQVQRLNRVDELEYKQDMQATLRVVADVRRAMQTGATGEQDMD